MQPLMPSPEQKIVKRKRSTKTNLSSNASVEDCKKICTTEAKEKAMSIPPENLEWMLTNFKESAKTKEI